MAHENLSGSWSNFKRSFSSPNFWKYSKVTTKQEPPINSIRTSTSLEDVTELAKENFICPRINPPVYDALEFEDLMSGGTIQETITRSNHIHNPPIKFGWHSLTGRDSSGSHKVNEDSVSVDASLGIFGVYDGNGKTRQLLLDMMGINQSDWAWASVQLGANYQIKDQLNPCEVSHFLKKALPPVFEHLISSQLSKDALLHAATTHFIQEQFYQIHQNVRDKCLMGSGSTAVLLHLSPPVYTYPSNIASHRTLIVANVGDSRAILSRNGKAIQLSTDSNPEHHFGASGFDVKHVFVNIMEVSECNQDEFIILVSDGVYNGLADDNTNQSECQQIINLVRGYLMEEIEVEDEKKWIFKDGADFEFAGMALIEKVRKLEEKKQKQNLVNRKIDDMTVLIVPIVF